MGRMREATSGRRLRNPSGNRTRCATDCCGDIPEIECSQCIDAIGPQRVTITLPSLTPDSGALTCCDFSGSYELEFEAGSSCSWLITQPDDVTLLWPCNEFIGLDAQFIRFTRNGAAGTAVIEARRSFATYATWEVSLTPGQQDCFDSPLVVPFNFSTYCSGTGNAIVVPGP